MASDGTNAAREMLNALQAEVWQRNADEPLDCDHECIAVCPSTDGLDVDFWGNALGESYAELIETIGSTSVAREIRSLTLRGPDEGANGTRNWDLSGLFRTDAEFPQLQAVTIQQSAPGDHNRTVVGSIYDEEGVLARLLAAAPELRVLVTPSAPSADFFDVGERPLAFLSVDAGYNTQNFLRNFAVSRCFPQLHSLAWGEYNETYMDDFREHVTPYEHYRELFSSEAFACVRAFELRNPVLSDDQLRELRRLRDRHFQFKLVRYEQEYVDTA